MHFFSKVRLLAPALVAASLSLVVPPALAETPAKTYATECGSCHVPYPTNFLPAASWQRILDKLDQHFGDSAELPAATLQTIGTYLKDHSYDTSNIKARYGKRFDTPGTPLRVTETKLFKSIHGEISEKRVRDNPKVKTFSRCDACHAGAAHGSFDEDEVRIPR